MLRSFLFPAFRTEKEKADRSALIIFIRLYLLQLSRMISSAAPPARIELIALTDSSIAFASS